MTGDRMTPFDVVLVAGPARVREAEAAVALAGGRVVRTIGWAGVADPDEAGAVLALAMEGTAPDLLARALPVLGEAVRRGQAVVATLAPAQIDEVAAALMATDVQLLCEPSLAEHAAALALAGQVVRGGGLADRWREGEAERLRRLNEEVARIAERLARLTARDRGPGGGDVADRHIAFGFAPPATDADPQLVRRLIRARRMRDAFFGENLFEDPAWDMLLDLYAAQLESRQVSVSSLCIAAAVAPTTALRWITKLSDAGLFERRPDASDRRRAFMVLSARALKGMDGYVAAVRRVGLPIA